MRCDLKYLPLNHKTGNEVAQVKAELVFLDYKKDEIVEIPKIFRTLFEKVRE